MKSAGKARSNGLYRHIRTSKEIIRNLLNDYIINYQALRRYGIRAKYLLQQYWIFSAIRKEITGWKSWKIL